MPHPIYNKYTAPLFEHLSTLPIDKLDEFQICSPQLKVLPRSFNTKLFKVFDSPNLRYIQDVEAKTSSFDSIRRPFSDFGFHSDVSIVHANVSKPAVNQISQLSTDVIDKPFGLHQDHHAFEESFTINGFSTGIPSEIILPTVKNMPAESIFTPEGNYEPKNSFNSIPTTNLYKGRIFEYFSLIALSMLHPDQRLYRQFTALNKQINSTYAQHYRVDALINDQAYECKWHTYEDWKLRGDKHALSKQNIPLKGIIFKPNSAHASIPFTPFSELVEPLQHSHITNLPSTINRFTRCLNLIEQHDALPKNTPLLSTALYNLLDQSALLPSNEKIDFLINHINKIFDLHRRTADLQQYLHTHQMHLPEFSFESTFRYQDHIFQSFIQPVVQAADSNTDIKNIKFYSNDCFSLLEAQAVLSVTDRSEIQEAFNDEQKYLSLVNGTGRIGHYEYHDLLKKIKNHKASVKEIYTLLESIPAQNHDLFAKSSDIFAIL